MNAFKEEQLTEVKTKSENKLKKFVDVIGLLTAVIAVLSIITSVIFQYISVGRCLYFDFDLDYYDFSLSNSTKFYFYLSMAAGILSGVTSILIYNLWRKVSPYFSKIKHTKRWKRISFVIIIILHFVTMYALSDILIPDKKTATWFYAFVFIFTIFIYFFIYAVNSDIEKKWPPVVSSVLTIVIIIIIGACMKIEYEEAKDQKNFPIIVENVDQEVKYYVVISKGKENYSAFLCEFEEENGVAVLYIITDKHKYFNINDTETTKMKFHFVERKETTPLTVGEMIDKYGQSKIN